VPLAGRGGGLSPATPHRLNAQYNLAAPDGLPARIAAYQRRKMFRAFIDFARPSAADTVLDIGATSDRSYGHSNYFEAWYPYKPNVTAIGLDDASFLVAVYPGLRFVRGDGRALPFGDGSFDYVHSSAVLEHVGGRERQHRFVSEAWRVCRKGILITTPNRWFPLEFHTVLPLLHWLPPGLYRTVLGRLGQPFFAREDNLNLLSRGALDDLAVSAGIRKQVIASVALLGWSTNLLLMARRSPP
jgi:SAM-dependent methyltransferase